MKSSPGTIIVASSNSSGGITNYTTITSPVSQQQQQNPFLSADGNTTNNNNSSNQSALFHQTLSDRGIVLTQQQPHHPPREMMIINCNDMDQHSLHQNNNNTPPNRMTMSVSVTPVQEQQQQLNNNSPTATNTTTILLPIQMTSSNSEQSSALVSGGGGGLYFDQHGNGHTINTSTNSNSATANQAIEEIIILNTSSSSSTGTATEQYQSEQVQMHQMQPRSNPVIEVVGGQSYERIIMISSPPSTAKLEASSNGQQHLVKNGETIISLVSTTKDSAVAGGAPEMIVFAEANGGMDGKITTTTTREGHGLKELDGDDDVFKFVLDEVECREPVQRSTRQLRSRGTKDPMLGSGGLEILMMDSPVAVGEKKDNVNSDGVVVEMVNEGEQEEQDAVTGEDKDKEQIVIGE